MIMMGQDPIEHGSNLNTELLQVLKHADVMVPPPVSGLFIRNSYLSPINGYVSDIHAKDMHSFPSGERVTFYAL